MFVEPKIDKPLRIRLGVNDNKILADDSCSEDYPLSPGVMFGDQHFGFSLIVDTKKGQRETIYPTQCNIQAVGLDNGILKVYEAHKRGSWRFQKNGVMQHSSFDEFTDDIRSVYDLVSESPEFFVGDYRVENPIRIHLSKDPLKSTIQFREDESYPLTPGVKIGSLHYGFILTIDSDGESKEVVYPTQGNIDAIGNDESDLGTFKVFENGKYHPWIFTAEGVFKQKASYNAYSRKDLQFIEENFTVDSSSDSQELTKGQKV